MHDEMISPERFNRDGAWRFTRWLYQIQSIERDSYYVTQVMDAVAGLSEQNYYVFQTLILRFGLFDGANYSVSQVVEIFDCGKDKVMGWIVAGIELLTEALGISMPYPKTV